MGREGTGGAEDSCTYSHQTFSGSTNCVVLASAMYLFSPEETNCILTTCCLAPGILIAACLI